jgi:hypothetical protein
MCVFGILALPSLLFSLSHISVVGMFEESIGYRYFYSLRHVYSDERPFIPQGQLVGIAHMVIQLVLTAIGHPIRELFPRMDIFVSVAPLIPLGLAACAFVWTALALKCFSSRALLAAGLCFVAYNSRLPLGWTAIPDYMPWVIPVVLVAAAAGIRIVTGPTREPIWSLSSSLWLGAYAALCLAIKPTYMVFPLAVGSLMLARDHRWPASIAFGALSLLTAALGALFLLACYLRFSVLGMTKFLQLFPRFVDAQRATLPWGEYGFLFWLHDMNWQSVADYTPWILMTAVSSVLIGMHKHLRVLLALVPATMLSLYFCYDRYYYITLIEVSFFSFATAVIVLVAIARSDLVLTLDRTRFLLTNARLLTAVLLLTVIAYSTLANLPTLLVGYRALDSANHRLHALMQRAGGTTLTLMVDNAHRPFTVESALCKGGADILENAGPTPLISSLFPERRCELLPVPLESERFDNILFSRMPEESIADALMKLESYYRSSLAGIHCEAIAWTPTERALIFCTRPK